MVRRIKRQMFRASLDWQVTTHKDAPHVNRTVRRDYDGRSRNSSWQFYR